MHLKSISFKHHKIFGDIKINFFADSEPLIDNLVEKYHSDIFIDVDTTDNKNHYTFIIGDNGIGKTVLFRNITHFINWNNSFDEPKLNGIINFYSRNAKYGRYNESDPGHYELLSVDIFNKYFSLPGVEEYDFLKYFDAQLMFISGSFEKPPIHKNPRYRSFNYTSEINETKILFLRALTKFIDDPKLKALDRLLGYDNNTWKLNCGLAIQARTVQERGLYRYIFTNTDDVNIFNFLDLLRIIEIDESDKLVIGNLNRRQQEVFDVLYNSGAFFKLYFNSNLSFRELFNKMNDNPIINRIEEFLRDLDNLNTEKTLNVRIDDDQRADWDFLITEATAVTSFDVDFLCLLFSLNLIQIRISTNGESIDHMSSGQKNLLRTFSYFSELPLPSSPANLILFFDEPENSLHPRWQQEFPLHFKLIAEEVYEIKGSHFIFATHSPVLIMKSALIPGTNVLRFYKDRQGKFGSELVKGVNAFSIEQVLMDEFRMTYRNQSAETELKKVLGDEFQRRTGEESDPINSVRNYFDLRNKINDLYNRMQGDDEVR